MAVEAPHVNLFSPQILSNMEMIDQGNNNVYGNGVKSGYGMAPMENTLLPIYASSGMMDVVPAVALKADSGLTNSLPISRKRSRDSSSFDPSLSYFANAPFLNQNQINNNQRGTFTFLGEDVSMQIYQQQLEIDRFIAHHAEKVRTEMEATRKRNSMRLIAAAEEGIRKRLRSKEEEIVKIGKLNWALEEKIKSLSVENQIWQQMAQTNEATANALRCNLQQILTQIQQKHQSGCADKTTAEDVESCCGSNYEEENHHQRTLERDGVGPMLKVNTNRNQGNDDDDAYCTTASDNGGSRLNRRCRNCGKEESCVLLLPCRHLCICTVCESSINVCPICKFTKNASVHVNTS